MKILLSKKVLLQIKFISDQTLIMLKMKNQKDFFLISALLNIVAAKRIQGC